MLRCCSSGVPRNATCLPPNRTAPVHSTDRACYHGPYPLKARLLPAASPAIPTLLPPSAPPYSPAIFFNSIFHTLVCLGPTRARFFLFTAIACNLFPPSPHHHPFLAPSTPLGSVIFRQPTSYSSHHHHEVLRYCRHLWRPCGLRRCFPRCHRHHQACLHHPGDCQGKRYVILLSLINWRPPRKNKATDETAAFFAGDQRFYVRGVDYQPGTYSVPEPMAVHLKLT